MGARGRILAPRNLLVEKNYFFVTKKKKERTYD